MDNQENMAFWNLRKKKNSNTVSGDLCWIQGNKDIDFFFLFFFFGNMEVMKQQFQRGMEMETRPLESEWEVEKSRLEV